MAIIPALLIVGCTAGICVLLLVLTWSMEKYKTILIVIIGTGVSYFVLYYVIIRLVLLIATRTTKMNKKQKLRKNNN